MPKMYFGNKKKKEPNLKIIIAVILVLMIAVYGAYRLWNGVGSLVSIGGSFGSEDGGMAELEKARGLAASGDLVAARPIFERLASHSRSNTIAPQALMALADMESAAGKPDEALKLLQEAVEKYPDSPDRPAAAAQYARALEKAGSGEEASALFKDLSENAPPGMRAPALLGMGRNKESEQDLAGARDLYRQAMKDASFDTSTWNEAVDALGAINVAMAFATKENIDSKYYTIEKGDNLINIGIKLNTTQGMLMRANGLDESARLRPGDRLKYTPKDFRIIIERSTCRLFLLDDNGLFKRYFVGLGMPGHETVLGNYTIGNKQKDPTWFKPGSAPIGPGDPENELGTRWMPLAPSETGLPSDLGIHGTIAPETIGQYKSHGCPRMKKEDVEELFDLVVRSTPVQIVEKVTPEQIG